MPEHARLAGADDVRPGLVSEAERFMPDYSLVPDWGSSIMFGTRGCIRKCAFCAVPRLEGKSDKPAEGIAGLVHKDHRKIVLWDNNILGVSNWRDIVAELEDFDLEVDFNQGLDARLITEEIAEELGRLRIRPIRMAYDIPSERKAVKRAIGALEAAGFKRRRMVVYTLYNFTDTPGEFLNRVVDLLSWGVVSYPMRYEPLNSLVKNRYVSPHWSTTQLEMVARARRVMGAGGAFPPYDALRDKLSQAQDFEEAFTMRDRGNERRYPKGIAGQVELPTGGISAERGSFRELLNDPATMLTNVQCESCGDRVPPGDRGFGVQDYAGRYVGYVCPNCHPNRKWINALWRSVLGSEFSFDGLQPSRSAPVGLISRTVH